MGINLNHDHSRSEVTRVDRQEAKLRLMKGDAIFIDVRSPEEYQFSHIPGAINVPLPEIRKRMAGLPTEKSIITYCT